MPTENRGYVDSNRGFVDRAEKQALQPVRSGYDEAAGRWARAKEHLEGAREDAKRAAVAFTAAEQEEAQAWVDLEVASGHANIGQATAQLGQPGVPGRPR